MSTIGQLVYNLEDYDNSGEIISSDAFVKNDDNKAKHSIYENFFSSNGILPNSGFKKIGIQAPPGTVAVIGTASDQSATAQRIMIGRTGIYEMEDDEVQIRYFRFEQQFKWVYNQEDSEKKIAKGMLLLKEAAFIFEENKNLCFSVNNKNYYELTNDFNVAQYYTVLLKEDGTETIKLIEKKETDIIPIEAAINYYKLSEFVIKDDSWQQYDIVFNDYLLAYEKAYSIYLQGVNGVYTRIEKNPDAETEFERYELIDPKNIIIDYVTI